MTDEQRLKIINYIMGGEVANEADELFLDKKATKREQRLAKLIMQIYRIVHPRFSPCKHPDWILEAEELLKTV